MSPNFEMAKMITEKVGGSYLDSDNILYKWVDGEFIGKPSVQTKSLSRKWFDEVSPDEIDTRHYNLDGTKK
jgi:hypothetical protein